MDVFVYGVVLWLFQQQRRLTYKDQGSELGVFIGLYMPSCNVESLEGTNERETLQITQNEIRKALENYQKQEKRLEENSEQLEDAIEEEIEDAIEEDSSNHLLESAKNHIGTGTSDGLAQEWFSYT